MEQSRQSNRMGQSMRFTILCLCALSLAACGMETSREESELMSQFTPITTRDGFVANVVGRQWQSDEIRVTFAKGGGLTGTVNGIEVTGGWTWAGDQFCSNFRVADSGGQGCSKLGIKPGELLVVPLEGAGAPYTWTEV